MATAPNRWQCHICDGGPHLYATTTRCTNVIDGRQCGHAMCQHCKRDNDIPPPLIPAPLTTRRAGFLSFGHGALDRQNNNSTTMTMTQSSNNHHRKRGYGGLPVFRHASGPTMVRWWRCHHCSYTNNPDLCPERCAGCDHYRCAHCTGVAPVAR